MTSVPAGYASHVRNSTVRERAATFFGVRDQERQSPYWLPIVLIAVAITIESILKHFGVSWRLAILIGLAVVIIPVRCWWMIKKRRGDTSA